MNKLKTALSGKSFKYGANAAILTVIVIAILVFVNLIALRFEWKLDLTKEGAYTLTKETKDVLNQLKEPIDVTVLLPATDSGEPIAEKIKETLDQYAKNSSMIKVNYTDPNKNPATIKSLTDKYDITSAALILEKGKIGKAINPDDIYSQNQETGEEKLNAEESITNAILFLNSGKTPSAYVIEGHGETPLAKAVQGFKKDDYKTAALNLSTAEIPADADLLIISSPQKDYNASEIKKLDSYFANGKAMLIALDYTEKSLPQFDTFLKEWGVQAENDYVVETDKNHYFQSPLFNIPTIQSHEITSRLISNNVFVLIPEARSIKLLFEDQKGIKATALLKSSNKSFGRTDFTDKSLQATATDIKGPLTLAVAITRPYNDKTAKMLVLGSSHITEAEILQMGQWGNQDFFNGGLRWLTNSGPSVSIKSKSISGEKMAINELQSVLIALLVIIVIPLAVLIFALVVWLRRRHL
ncbi:MAG: GldG family protein [Hyphomonadaceae bacterium]|nr:GldG family protein [Clostridia bacterium]